MTDTFICPSMTGSESFAWNGRTWLPMADAMYADELFALLRAKLFAYDSESARNFANNGGTFYVSYYVTTALHIAGTFDTYTVVSAGNGLKRLYRACGYRYLRDGSTW